MAWMSLYPLKNALGMSLYFPDQRRFCLVYGWDLCKDLAAVGQIVTGQGVELVLTVASLRGNIQEIADIEAETLPNSEFPYEEGKAAVKELARIESEAQFATRFPEDLRPSLHSLSPLYRRVLQTVSGPFTLDIGCPEFLLTDLETLRNLQIIKDDFHPSTIKSAGRAKEGFSVFNLVDKTVTRQGRKLLRQWMLQPLRKEEKVQERLDKVAYWAMNPVQAMETQRAIKDICDLEKVACRYRSYSEKGSDWGKVWKSLKSWLSLIQLRSDLSATISEGKEDIQQLTNLCISLETTLDLNHKDSHPSVRSGISADLDYMRQSYESLEVVLKEAAGVEATELQLGVRQQRAVGVVYFPQLGYLVEMKGNREDSVGTSGSAMSVVLEQIDRLKYEFQFRTEEAVYYKSDRCRELDAQFGDLISLIKDYEGAEIRRLESDVLGTEAALIRVSRASAELDAIISLSAAAGLYGWTRPSLLTSPGIEVINGRHPLVELCVPHFIPNDVELTATQRIGLITGPNSSGKSVYMKMVGIIVYLAHCGSFVPAESAAISLCDRLFTRINIRDSLDSSAFESELKRLSCALTGASDRSLLLLDEVGKSTATVDGMALLHAIATWLQRISCPFALLSTHYKELVTLGLLRETEQMRLFTMEMKESEEPIFLYKLIPGLPQSSQAFHCAKLAKVPVTVLNRAAALRQQIRCVSSA